jgi:hypothetical protein
MNDRQQHCGSVSLPEMNGVLPSWTTVASEYSSRAVLVSQGAAFYMLPNAVSRTLTSVLVRTISALVENKHKYFTISFGWNQESAVRDECDGCEPVSSGRRRYCFPSHKARILMDRSHGLMKLACTCPICCLCRFLRRQFLGRCRSKTPMPQLLQSTESDM